MTKAKKDSAGESPQLQVSLADYLRTRDSDITLIRTLVPMSTQCPSPEYLSHEQIKEGLRALELLTVPLQHVSDIVLKLARDIVYGAADPIQCELIATPQVVTGLASLQSAVGDLSRAYIAHTNTVVGRGPNSSLELLNLTNPLGGESALFGMRALTEAPTEEPAGKPKRKRAPHDKNAPKRPMTPYFLYLKTARPMIANELGPGTKAQDVSSEGTRRWQHMAEEEKMHWRYKYGVNFARYEKIRDAYKEGKPEPVVTDEEATELYETSLRSGKIKIPKDDEIPEAGEEEIEDAEDVEDVGDAGEVDNAVTGDSSEEESEEETTPEPPKIPTPPPKNARGTKHQKTPSGAVVKKSSTTKDTAPATIEQAISPPAERKSKSPEKERKKKSSRKSEAKGGEGAVEAKKEAVVAGTNLPPKESAQKDKRSRKKRKSEAVDV